MRDRAKRRVEGIARILREEKIAFVKFDAFGLDEDAVAVTFDEDRASESPLFPLIGNDRVGMFGVSVLFAEFLGLFHELFDLAVDALQPRFEVVDPFAFAAVDESFVFLLGGLRFRAKLRDRRFRVSESRALLREVFLRSFAHIREFGEEPIEIFDFAAHVFEGGVSRLFEGAFILGRRRRVVCRETAVEGACERVGVDDRSAEVVSEGRGFSVEGNDGGGFVGVGSRLGARFSSDEHEDERKRSHRA